MKMMINGDKVILSPKSKRGKNRIREHGSIWTVIQTRGNDILVESEFRTMKIDGKWVTEWLWVSVDSDNDFSVILSPLKGG